MGDAKGMSAKDKADFGATCSARWPCEAAAVHSYVSPCPIGWLLEGNSVCVPPDNSSCGTAPANLTVKEKQHLEAACDCSWPDADVCTKNYSRSCPTGWFEGNGECTAAPGYDRCGTVQRFGGWSVAEKMSWEAQCGSSWPCVRGVGCKVDWGAPCPADWVSYADGAFCFAPNTFAGTCPGVLRGVSSMTESEKAKVASECGIAWPCVGETISPAATTHGAPTLDGPV